MNFSERLEKAVRDKNSCLMLGLDPNPDKFPKGIAKTAEGAFQFCLEILKATHDLVCGIKIQMAYFEVFGAEGIRGVEMLLKLAKELGLITLVDGKRNDIGSTAEAYAKAYLADGPLSCDACSSGCRLRPVCGRGDRARGVLRALSGRGALLYLLRLWGRRQNVRGHVSATTPAAARSILR